MKIATLRPEVTLQSLADVDAAAYVALVRANSEHLTRYLAVDPPRFGLRYLVAESACGRGIATLAVASVLEHATINLRATDVFAGVTHGNISSAAVLERNAFRLTTSFETYDRYHRRLG